MLARPAMAVAYPGYRPPDDKHRLRGALAGAALVHAAGITALVVLATLYPPVQDRILHLTILKPPPEPPPIVAPEPEPEPPKPVQVELPKPKPPPPPKPVPKREPEPAPPPPVAERVPAPPKPQPVRPEVRPEPIRPDPVAPPDAMPRAARPAVERRSSVRAPVTQIDQMAARTELPDAVAVAVVANRAPAPPARAARPSLPPAAIDRVAVPRPEMAAAAAPVPRPSVFPPAPARSARPAALTTQGPVSGRRPGLRGVALSELLPCVSDARELALKQKTVAAARNASLCESPAGRFHFVETKNVNAFLMSIEQAPGRRSGDRCEELTLALECLASLPPRSR